MVSVTGKHNVSHLLEWLRHMVAYQQPTDSVSVGILAEFHIKRPKSFQPFKDGIMYAALEWGRYGKEIRPSLDTFAEARGVGRTTAGRWIGAAVALGILEEAKPPAWGVPGVYNVAPFWQESASVSPNAYPVADDPWSGSFAS